MVWEIIAWIGVAFCAVPLLFLTLEALASLIPRRYRLYQGPRPHCVVLIPAHDEASGISLTLAKINKQLQPGDRVVVVADNCSDATAQLAKEAGAEVLERFSETERGKGFALDFGLRYLEANPPEYVVILDADSELEEGSLHQLVQQCHQTQLPTQAIYLIGTGREPDPKRRFSAFAVLLKNKIRPLGLNNLGLPVLLTGTGMAFPWKVLRSAHLGTGNIVEDMKLGLDLARGGYPPKLCPLAWANGAAAPDVESTKKQRNRWEQGHLRTLLRESPKLFLNGLLRLNLKRVALAMELGIPPLSLLGLVVLSCLIYLISTIFLISTNYIPLMILIFLIIITFQSIVLAALAHGRDRFSLTDLTIMPIYLAWKVPIYLGSLLRPEKRWVRTKRD